MENITHIIWKRYANPWSIWTRFYILPVLIIAMWSRIWIGKWFLLFVLITLLWILINPRILSGKATKSNWAIKAILGERLWLDRHKNLIPEHHYFVITILQIIVILNFGVCVIGILLLNPWITFVGLVITYITMFWFLDRMVWLYNDNKFERKKVHIEKLRKRQRRRKRHNNSNR